MGPSCFGWDYGGLILGGGRGELLLVHRSGKEPRRLNLRKPVRSWLNPVVKTNMLATSSRCHAVVIDVAVNNKAEKPLENYSGCYSPWNPEN